MVQTNSGDPSLSDCPRAVQTLEWDMIPLDPALAILLLRILGWRQRLCQPLLLCLHFQHPANQDTLVTSVSHRMNVRSEAAGPYTSVTWTHGSSKYIQGKITFIIISLLASLLIP